MGSNRVDDSAVGAFRIAIKKEVPVATLSQDCAREVSDLELYADLRYLEVDAGIKSRAVKRLGVDVRIVTVPLGLGLLDMRGAHFGAGTILLRLAGRYTGEGKAEGEASATANAERALIPRVSQV